jgi:hypothetical protein
MYIIELSWSLKQVYTMMHGQKNIKLYQKVLFMLLYTQLPFQEVSISHAVLCTQSLNQEVCILCCVGTQSPHQEVCHAM